MKNTFKDGWHNFLGNDVYVKDNTILRGVCDGLTTCPYRRVKDGWNNASGLTVFAFLAGYRRNTIRMM